MAEDNEDTLDVAKLEGWNAASPPPGFAERVARVWLDERGSIAAPQPRVRRATAVVAAAMVGVLLLGIAFAWTQLIGDVTTGSLSADARASATLGGRAQAVAEPGADLRWQVARDGRVDVQQSRGAVFYRVDRGAAFEVVTPHGSVRVSGTCFTVEIEDMERSGYVKAGAVGAVLAAAVVVTVYEGGVVLARDGQEVALAAGDRGRADEHGPRRVEVDDVQGSSDDVEASADAANAGELAQRLRSQGRELAAMRERETASTAEIQSLRAQIDELGGTPEMTSALARAQRCASTDRDTKDCSFADPDQATLVEMARCGTVKVDIPSFMLTPDEPAGFAAQWGAKAGLSPAELAAIGDLGEQFRQDYVESLQRLYAEAGGPAELAEEQGASALEGMIEPLLSHAELEAARRRLAEERAGLVDPADFATLSLADRYIRKLLGVGDDFQAQVATQLGPERARELRLQGGGWPGGRSTYRGDCKDE